MSKLIFISLFILPNLLFAQTIYMHPTNGQRHYQWGKQQHVHEVIKNPDFSFDKRTLDCYYEIDLEQKTSTFWTPSTESDPVVLPISEIQKEGSEYTIKLSSYGDIDASFTYPVTMYIDIAAKSFIYAKYDPYLDRSFSWQPKSEIQYSDAPELSY